MVLRYQKSCGIAKRKGLFCLGISYALKYVDEIVPYSTEKELMDILLSYPINVRILGEEYESKTFTGRQECMNKGIKFYFNKREHTF